MNHTMPRTTHDLVGAAEADGQFNVLLSALRAADLLATLRGAGPFTLFAPTDAAFAKLPFGSMDELLGDVPALRNVLLYHVTRGRLGSTELSRLHRVLTAQGQPLVVLGGPGALLVGGALVVRPDVAAANGVIHILDRVLLPV